MRQATGWRSRLLQILTPRKQASAPVAQPEKVAENKPPSFEGSQGRPWLRVLCAQELLQAARAGEALDGIWRQSKLAIETWDRDLLPAIEAFAEFVQLMPASESHHHAHPGGLLVHTIEMLLAAMTWRNGHFLPAGASIEQIDEERDTWTYVVFYATLLHDIAKPMTDLRIQWCAEHMPEPLRWTPLAGSLNRVCQGRVQAQYKVEFTPKALRDYGAHSRLALTLLHQIAPPTALAFLAHSPHALDALSLYLSGHDKTSLVAQIVRRADQASTARALTHGSKLRFDSSTSVPLIELLMQAVKSMLQHGTELPLNRSGAAGWVHEGHIYFVAKRLADATRSWIKQHAPEESVPGDKKNDRFFDTWQEYGVIEPNPVTGQAIWYVIVHGQNQDETAQQEDAQEEQGGYSHRLSMLKFPLLRLYDSQEHHPPAMQGWIEVLEKRADKAETANEQDTETSKPESEEQETAATAIASTSAKNAASKPKPAQSKPTQSKVREPSFNKPKTPETTSPPSDTKSEAKTARLAKAVRQEHASRPNQTEVIQFGADSIDGFDLPDDPAFLDEEDDVKEAMRKQAAPALKTQKPENKPQDAAKPNKKYQIAAPQAPQKTASNSATGQPKHAATEARQTQEHAAKPSSSDQDAADLQAQARPLLLTPEQQARMQSMDAALTMPVVLQAKLPELPELPHETASKKVEPSPTAVAFMQWLQQGLASREIKYNEAGAPVHFTDEGMALVSPLIFKLYVQETTPAAQADTDGLQVQREVIKAGWHRMDASQGKGRFNILRYEVIGRGGTPVGKLSAVVLAEPDRWVLPVPPANPVLRLM